MNFRKMVIVLLAFMLISSNFTFIGSVSADTEGDSSSSSNDWQLVWSDEFDGPEINMENWSYDVPTNGRYNGEIQSYTEDNAFIQDGSLILEAEKEDITEADGQTYNYSSAKMITKGKQNWTYGKIEVMAKMPTGQGIWPAIWMMPEDEPFYGTWPVSGEIDIMEMLGHKPNEVHGTIHFGEPHQQRQGTYELPEGETFADGYHEYSIEWEPGEIRWYIDDILYHTANDWFTKHKDNADDYTYPAPFDQDFFLIMNISVGGGWPGDPDETTVFPQQMAVDYVRVYEKDEYPVHEKPESEESEGGETRAPIEGNYVYNGSFDVEDPELDGVEGVQYSDYWTYSETKKDNATLTVNDGVMDVQIASGGDVDYGVQLYQTPIPLEKGAKYRVSFKAKAEHERPLKIKVGSDGDRSYIDYAEQDPFTITPSWDDYSFEFTMQEETDVKARYEFNMGLDNGDISLDNVKLEKIEDAPIIDPSKVIRDPLLSGNYIYNGTFDQGTDRIGYWEFKTDATADATSYIGSAVNERRFETRINYGGDDEKSVQLIQKDFNLEKDRSYQLTFDASAEANRSIQVSVVNSDSEVVHEETLDLTTTTQEYTLDYTMDLESDNKSALLFNFGGNNNDVEIDNVFMKRLPLEDIEGNLLKNGLFDGLANWTVTAYGDGKANFAVEEGKAKTEISNIGTVDHQIQLFQEDVNMEQNATYKVSFDAKSSVDRPLRVQIQENGGDYTGYFDQTVSLTDSIETYTYTFEMTKASDPAAKFGFALGKDAEGLTPADAHDVYIDNVILKKVDAQGEEPGDDQGGETGENPTDGPLIENGSFDGLTGWSPEAYNGGVATFDASEGQFKAAISEYGPQPYDIQLYQDDFELEQGETYEVSFKAKSTEDRTMITQIQNYKNWDVYFAEKPSLTSEYQTFSYQFTMDQATDSKTRLSFQLGDDPDGEIPDGPHDVYIDDVVIQKVDPSNPGEDQGEEPGDNQGGEPGDNQSEKPEDNQDKEPGKDQDKNPTTVVVDKETDLVKNETKKTYTYKKATNSITLEKNVIKNIADDYSVELTNGNVKVKVPVSLLPEGKDITVNFNKVSDEIIKKNSDALSELYDLTILADGQEITNFGDKTVTLTFTVKDPSKVKNWKDIRVVYVDENGDKKDIIVPTSYDEKTGEVVAEVSHFSTYGVFEIAGSSDEQQDGQDLPKTATSMFNLLALGLFVVMLGAALAIIAYRRNKDIA